MLYLWYVKLRRSQADIKHRDTPENNPGIPFSFTSENMKRVEQIIAYGKMRDQD